MQQRRGSTDHFARAVCIDDSICDLVEDSSANWDRSSTATPFASEVVGLRAIHQRASVVRYAEFGERSIPVSERAQDLSRIAAGFRLVAFRSDSAVDDVAKELPSSSVKSSSVIGRSVRNLFRRY
jgi:hypothetical protein